MKTKSAVRPTLRDVAVLSGTSIATASNVISGKKNKYVSEMLRRKVLDAASQLGYTPNQLARSMKGKSRRIIAMLVPELHNSIYMRMVQGAEKVASERGYLLLICSTLGDPAKEQGYVESLMAEQVDGFLLAVSLEGTESVQKLQMLNIPFVVLDRPFPSMFPYDSVAFDGGEAIALAVRHLYEKGHRSICYMGLASDDMEHRHASFRKACNDFGLDDAKCPIRLGLLAQGEGERLIGACKEECSAIVIGSHLIAEGVVKAMRNKGVVIPQDVSVVMVGNPIWTEIASPGFTAVELPHPGVGSIGMKKLLDRIEGSDKPKEQLWLDCSLVERASVKDLGSLEDEAGRHF
jgi:LacI family transcriptional regulator